MKHGPIALLDESTPVVCVATDMPVLDKMISNMQEVRARGAHVIAVATEGDDRIAAQAEEVIYVPRTDWMLQALLAVIPLQLFAYYVARKRGPERRPAAQPREDRHGRVAGAAPGRRGAAASAQVLKRQSCGAADLDVRGRWKPAIPPKSPPISATVTRDIWSGCDTSIGGSFVSASANASSKLMLPGEAGRLVGAVGAASRLDDAGVRLQVVTARLDLHVVLAALVEDADGLGVLREVHGDRGLERHDAPGARCPAAGRTAPGTTAGRSARGAS